MIYYNLQIAGLFIVTMVIAVTLSVRLRAGRKDIATAVAA